MGSGDLFSLPTQEVDAAIGRALSGLLDETAVDRDAFAADLDISSEQLADFEKGQQRIAAQMLYRMAKLLDTDVTAFFGFIKTDTHLTLCVTPEERRLISLFREMSGLGREMMLAALETKSDCLDELLKPMRDVWVDSELESRRD